MLDPQDCSRHDGIHFYAANLVWAVHSDDITTVPPAGLIAPVVGTKLVAEHFHQDARLVWVPDISVNEHDNRGEPLTLGGHNWVFDQGSTTCKETDVGGASWPTVAWSIPPNNTTDCILLPIIKVVNNPIIFQNLGDVPQRGSGAAPASRGIGESKLFEGAVPAS